jgi:integrase
MSGSVFKRCTRCGNRVKNKTCGKCGGSSNRWAYLVWVGKDADGRWTRQIRSGFPTRRDAERALRELLTSIEGGTYVQTSSLTLASFLREEWLPATSPPRVKYETWADRKRNLENYVIPRIGAIKLQELNASHLNRLYTELLSEGRLRAEGGLSPTSVVRIHAMLRKACNDAVRWGLISRNPVSQADPPPLRVVQAARKRSMHTWSGAELRRFLEATEGHQHHAMWFYASSTGVRRSELLGQRRADLNLDAGTVTVRQTVTSSANGFRPTDDQKSQRSARTVHLDLRTMAVLRAHLEHQDEIRRQVGRGWNEHGLVFPRFDGTWWNPPAITLAFIRAVKKVGVPRIRLQDLRHTHATLLLAAGVNPKVVSERLGHSSVAFTLDTYAHVMPGMQPEAAQLFINHVFRTDDGDGEKAAYSEDGRRPDEEDES